MFYKFSLFSLAMGLILRMQNCVTGKLWAIVWYEKSKGVWLRAGVIQNVVHEWISLNYALYSKSVFLFTKF